MVGKPPMAVDCSDILLTYPSEGVAQISIRAEPANALSLDLWRSLQSALWSLEHDGSTAVLIIASGLRREIFSAGNDLNELHAPSTSEARFTEFWKTSTHFLASLYNSPLYTVAAVRGACPAGGCAIALCCDERIALRAEGFAMGLNEAALGIAVPRFWARLMLRTGNAPGAIERMLTTGRMAAAGEAVRLGLVDRAVEGTAGDLAEEATRAAVAVAGKLRKGTQPGFRLTKNTVRGEFAEQWKAYAAEEARLSWALLSQKSVSGQLGGVLAKLGAGGKQNRRKSKL